MIPTEKIKAMCIRDIKNRKQNRRINKMTTYRNRIEAVMVELEDIESTIPTSQYSFELEIAIRAMRTILDQ